MTVDDKVDQSRLIRCHEKLCTSIYDRCDDLHGITARYSMAGVKYTVARYRTGVRRMMKAEYFDMKVHILSMDSIGGKVPTRSPLDMKMPSRQAADVGSDAAFKTANILYFPVKDKGVFTLCRSQAPPSGPFKRANFIKGRYRIDPRLSIRMERLYVFGESGVASCNVQMASTIRQDQKPISRKIAYRPLARELR